jgi:hypothetical protein
MSVASIPDTIDPTKPLHSWQTCASDLGSYSVTARPLDGRPEDLEGGRIGLVELSACTTRQASVTGPGRGSNSSGMQAWPSYKAILSHSLLRSVCAVIVKSATSKLVSSCVQITCPSEFTFCSGQCPVLSIIQGFEFDL